MECQFLSHWYDSTPKKSRRKRDSKPGSSALEAGALTTRPTRWSKEERNRLAGTVVNLNKSDMNDRVGLTGCSAITINYTI